MVLCNLKQYKICNFTSFLNVKGTLCLIPKKETINLILDKIEVYLQNNVK